MKKVTWIAVAAVVALAGGGAWWWSQRAKSDDVSYRTAKIERGSLQATVSASGAVNPVTQVSVGTQVSGQIKELYVDFNSEVKAGQLIATIDPETFEYRVRSALADVDAARAAVLTAQANIAASNAAVSRAKVDWTEAQRDLDRQQTLVDKQFVAQSVADKARALVASSAESVKAAEAQLGVTQAQIKSAQANVAQRESALAQARIDLSRTKITSPVTGIVIKRAIEKGQTVAASLSSPELFVIAQNLSDMQVDASIDESDVGRIRTGQKASFTVDAYPGQSFEGEVRQVRKAAQNVANVVTYVAVVGFTNTGGKLLPGMTANVRLVTDQRADVLKIPNSALRVRIAGIEPAVQGASGAATGAGVPAPARAASGATGAVANPVQYAGFSVFGLAFAQPAGGGGFAAQRERLVTELQLNPEQQGKLDAIQTELRPKFMALRDMPESERAAAREKVTLEMRQKITAMLTPTQRTQYQTLVANAPSTRASQGAASSAAPPAAPAAGGGAGQGGGPLAELRNRLIADVQLTPDQLAKVDAIYADVRPKFAALRDMAAEDRPKARERILADARAKVGDLLSAEQKPKYATLLAEAGSRTSTRGRIYVQGADGKPVAYNVRLGITDGTSTELLITPNAPNADVLKEGAMVIIGTSLPGAAAGGAAARPSGPRTPF